MRLEKLRFCTLGALLVLLIVTPSASAQQVDRVRLNNRSTVSGEVTKMSALAVTIDGRDGEKEIPVSQISSIIFKGEPSELTQARINANYSVALQTLESINLDSVRGEYILQEIDFLKAYCASKLALIGERPVKEAGQAMSAFVTKNPQNYHILEATEILGDLLVSVGNYSAAQTKYELLNQSPVPTHKIKSGVLVGQMMLAQKKYSEALAKFNEVMAIRDDSEESKEQKLAARLGQGVAKAATGSLNNGLEQVEEVIQNADPENAKLLARAYNSLGSIYQQAGRPKDALYAYLHVDLLYGRVAEAHAEALFHLVPLWASIGQEGESRKARQALLEQYPATTWAKQLN